MECAALEAVEDVVLYTIQVPSSNPKNLNAEHSKSSGYEIMDIWSPILQGHFVDWGNVCKYKNNMSVVGSYGQSTSTNTTSKKKMYVYCQESIFIRLFFIFCFGKVDLFYVNWDGSIVLWKPCSTTTKKMFIKQLLASRMSTT